LTTDRPTRGQRPGIGGGQLGEDGHVASLFPRAAELSNGLDAQARPGCVAVQPATASHARLSLHLAALLASTWKQLVQSLFIGMSGREWVVKASVFVALTFLAVVLPLAVWISRSRKAMAVLFTSFPLIAAATYLLAREVGASRLGSAFAGLALSFIPYHLEKAMGHVTQTHLELFSASGRRVDREIVVGHAPQPVGPEEARPGARHLRPS